MKRTVYIQLIIFLALLLQILSGCDKEIQPGTTLEDVITDTVENVDAISDYGDVQLNIRTGQLLQAGYSYADILDVSLNGARYNIPLVRSFKQIETGCAAVVAQDDGSVSFAMLLDYFAEKYGIANSSNDGDGQTVWTPASDRTFPVSVSISMNQHGGYADMYEILDRPFETIYENSNKTKEEFCNFREIKTRNIAAGVLYRGASPIDNHYGRRDLCNELLAQYGIRTVINMGDTQSEAESFDNFFNSHYSNLNVGYFKITNLDIRKIHSELAGAFRHITGNEPPYYVHCQESIDRSGIVAALLEGIMGADGEEILEDDMITYWNYYDIKKGSPEYEQLSNHVFKMLSILYGTEVTIDDDIPGICAEILKETGLDQSEIAALRSRLGGAKTH